MLRDATIQEQGQRRGFRVGRERQLELAEWEEVTPRRWRRRVREWGPKDEARAADTRAIASRKESTGKRIAVILPDAAERYVTTAFFEPPAKGP